MLPRPLKLSVFGIVWHWGRISFGRSRFRPKLMRRGLRRGVPSIVPTLTPCIPSQELMDVLISYQLSCWSLWWQNSIQGGGYRHWSDDAGLLVCWWSDSCEFCVGTADSSATMRLNIHCILLLQRSIWVADQGGELRSVRVIFEWIWNKRNYLYIKDAGHYLLLSKSWHCQNCLICLIPWILCMRTFLQDFNTGKAIQTR